MESAAVERHGRPRGFAGIAAGFVAVLLFALPWVVNLGGVRAGESYVWAVLLVGHLDQQRAGELSGDVEWADEQTYELRVEFNFVVNGSVVSAVGTPSGEYTDAEWHMSGSVAGEAFDCDPPVVGGDFTPEVSGSAQGDEISLAVDLNDASEVTEEDFDCGAGFTAYAGTTQYMRESLAFCSGDQIPLSTVPAHQAKSCIKSKSDTTPSGADRDRQHRWDIDVIRTVADSPSPSASTSASGTPTPSGSVSPSPSASGTTSPTPTPAVAKSARGVLLVLHKHLRATGAVVLASWGTAACVQDVPVVIERKQRTHWETWKKTRTNDAGVFSVKLLDTPGTFRGVAPKVQLGDTDVCLSATSKSRAHSHAPATVGPSRAAGGAGSAR